MPQIFRIGSYLVYFWVDEGRPLEPIHVHVSEGVPSKSATKIWITKSGKCLLANNRSKIPKGALNTIEDIIEARSESIKDKWYSTFGQITYYC